eukprot:6210908-Pleurochrysis_carterae.AAC.2
MGAQSTKATGRSRSRLDYMSAGRTLRKQENAEGYEAQTRTTTLQQHGAQFREQFRSKPRPAPCVSAWSAKHGTTNRL